MIQNRTMITLLGDSQPMCLTKICELEGVEKEFRGKNVHLWLLSGGECDNRRVAASFRHQPCQWAGVEIFPLLHLFWTFRETFYYPLLVFYLPSILLVLLIQPLQVLLQPTSETPEPDMKRRKRAR